MSEICPLDSRRSTQELWSKLVLVHLTTLFVFGHLLSIRGERLLSSKLVIFHIWSSLICFQHGLALLILMFAYGYGLITKAPGRNVSFKRNPKILFGSAERQHSDWRDSYEDSGSNVYHPADPERGLGPSAPEPEPDSKAKFWGRLIVVSFFSIQCIGSIVLFFRRQNQNAATISDRRVLELACGGLTVAVSTFLFLVLQAWLPSLGRQRFLDPNHLSWCETAIYRLRDIPDEEFWGFCLELTIDSGTARPLVPKQRMSASIISSATMTYFLLEPFSNSDMVWRAGLAVYMAFSAVPFMILGFFGGSTMSTLMDFLVSFCGLFVTLLVLPFQLVSIWRSITQEMGRLDSWTTNVPCPALWQDPMASWLWSLA